MTVVPIRADEPEPKQETLFGRLLREAHERFDAAEAERQ